MDNSPLKEDEPKAAKLKRRYEAYCACKQIDCRDESRAGPCQQSARADRGVKMIEQRIAHYRITSNLGQGGMGEVYRATDTKLEREVAIKVLPKSFAADAARLARFGHEAKVLAALG